MIIGSDGSAINTSHASLHPVDVLAQRSHAAALQALSPQTLARLRAARHASSAPARSWHWWAATAFSGLLAVIVGLQFFERPNATMTSAPVATTQESNALSDYRDSAGWLDENPDLYLWLASSDAQPMAME